MVKLPARLAPGRVTAALAVSAALAGCGGGKTTTATSHTAAAPAPHRDDGAPDGWRGGEHRAGAGSHDRAQPRSDRRQGWPCTIKVTDAAGRPLSGTVDVEFVFAGQVVGHDKPPTNRVENGVWHDVLTYPAESVGEPLALQAVVHTSQGTVKLDWPVSVKR